MLRDGLGKVWTIGKTPGKFDAAAAQNELDKMAKAIDQILHPPAGN